MSSEERRAVTYDHKSLIIGQYQHIANELGRPLVLLTEQGLYSGTPQHQFNPDVDELVKQVEQKREAEGREVRIAVEGRAIELINASFIPYNNPLARFNFETVLIFVDSIIGLSFGDMSLELPSD
ncbi:MAG TPA: hypothetical protein VGW38_22195 [Chloroflexota bacterium]|nr:hypothetical protein [Chloroflexota bacterium]